MLKQSKFSNYIELAKKLKSVNEHINTLNSVIGIDIYDSQIDFIEGRIIIGDYFSLLMQEDQPTNIYKKTLKYIG